MVCHLANGLHRLAFSRFNLLGVAIIAVCLGCGKPEQVIDGRAITSGIVSFNGQPLPGGSITFTSQDGSSVQVTTKIRDGGKYLTDRAPVGKSWVTIDTESLKFGNAAAFVAIPAKYKDPKSSGLTADIKPGNNENVDFALEK